MFAQKVREVEPERDDPRVARVVKNKWAPAEFGEGIQGVLKERNAPGGGGIAVRRVPSEESLDQRRAREKRDACEPREAGRVRSPWIPSTRCECPDLGGSDDIPCVRLQRRVVEQQALLVLGELANLRLHPLLHLGPPAPGLLLVLLGL